MIELQSREADASLERKHSSIDGPSCDDSERQALPEQSQSTSTSRVLDLASAQISKVLAPETFCT